MSTTEMTSNQYEQSGGREQAQEVAGTAADEGRHVAGTARDEAAHVADEARQQVLALISEATSQVDEQSRTQQRRMAGTLRTLGDDLSEMSAGRTGLASDLAHQVSERARSLATQLESREPRELLDSVRTFARQRPGTFLVGALAAGVLAGRFTRAAQAAATEDQGETRPPVTTTEGWADNSAAGSPVAGGDPLTPSTGVGTATAPVVSPVASPHGVPETDPGSRL